MAEHQAFPRAMELVASGKAVLGDDGYIQWKQFKKIPNIVNSMRLCYNSFNIIGVDIAACIMRELRVKNYFHWPQDRFFLSDV